MPLFLKYNAPSQRREKLILGGALPRNHMTRFTRSMLRRPILAKSKGVAKQGVKKTATRQRRQTHRMNATTGLTHRKRAGTQRRGRKKQIPKRLTDAPPLLSKNLKNVFKGIPANLLQRGKKAIPTHLIQRGKSALKQLATSRQIQNAVKHVGRSFANLPSSVADTTLARAGRKRKLMTDLDNDDDDDDGKQNTVPTTSKHFSPGGMTSMSYRGKAIQRGGTKQKGGAYLF